MRLVFSGLLIAALATAPAWAAPRLAGETNMTFDTGHGTQVEYLQPGGASFLWYPGNTVIVPGHWRLQSGGRQLCFLYGANSYNPVTRQYGGQWECEPAQLYASHLAEQAKGDVLGLAKRKAVPFRLARNRTTIAHLVEQAAH